MTRREANVRPSAAQVVIIVLAIHHTEDIDRVLRVQHRLGMGA